MVFGVVVYVNWFVVLKVEVGCIGRNFEIYCVVVFVGVFFEYCIGENQDFVGNWQCCYYVGVVYDYVFVCFFYDVQCDVWVGQFGGYFVVVDLWVGQCVGQVQVVVLYIFVIVVYVGGKIVFGVVGYCCVVFVEIFGFGVCCYYVGVYVVGCMVQKVQVVIGVNVV